MIRTLRITNFALIEKANIQFDSGFTVITGETGSGKSILLNALQLILGERANFQVIGSSGDKSVVEAEIDVQNFDLKSFFESNELDYYDTAIVRREIYKQGRSRAFINDVPVQLNILRQFSTQLIHIHSQYNTLELKDKDYQLRLLDVLSGNLNQREKYHHDFLSFQQDQKELNNKKETLSTLEQEQDYNTFQLEELNNLQLEQTNYEEIQEQLVRAENASDIQSAFAGITSFIDGEDGLADQLNRLLTTVLQNADIDSKLKDFKERLKSVQIELKDLSAEAENGVESDELDPEEASVLSRKIDEFNRLLFKHRAHNQQELMDLQSELTSSTEDLDKLKHEIEALEKDLDKRELELNKLADELHNQRVALSPKISKEIKTSLDALKLPDTVLEFQLSAKSNLTSWGKTSLEILFSPNKGIPAVPIHSAASGGELSRVMLALQNLLSKQEQLQTVLFDEIDTGVSGDVAQKMGLLLKDMGKSMQVIAITHLPQVAAKGGQHLSVRKQVVDGITRTFIEELDAESRLQETARLMSGDEINDAALENARALMS